MGDKTLSEQESQGYNGWPNYETWAVNLWLGNDEAGCALQQELLEQAQNTPNPSEGRLWGDSPELIRGPSSGGDC